MLAKLIVGAASISDRCVRSVLVSDMLHHVEQIFYNIYLLVCNIYIKPIAFINNKKLSYLLLSFINSC
jgi:hypothetical protein